MGNRREEGERKVGDGGGGGHVRGEEVCQQGVALDREMIDHCSAGAGRYSNNNPRVTSTVPSSSPSLHTGTRGPQSPPSAVSLPQHAARTELSPKKE